ncbi:calpain-9-like [Mytilus trossulus]|uniref:calpain-9-like n=1 Tax=Mytilus trossulus TaxID=6551 RepID=UPI00300789B9
MAFASSSRPVYSRPIKKFDNSKVDDKPTYANEPPKNLPHQYQNGSPFDKVNKVGVSRPFNRETETHSKHHRGKSNFDNIRSECLRRRILYEDPDFPAKDSSIYYSRTLPYRIEWKRPYEISATYRLKPNFFVDTLDSASRFDVNQGELGDCWVLSAIACLTSPDHRELFRRVVPADQGFQDGWYAGIFRFNFWHFGKWVEVVVDDRLPTYRDQLVFIHSNQSNEFWAALLEKAYAKLYGSYEALKSGNVGDALSDFTGGVSEYYTLRGQKANYPKALVNILFKALDRQSLIGCGINLPPDGRSQTMPDGLVTGHAYSVTDLREILLMSDSGEIPITLIRVRNPWGYKIEWRGRWGEKSREWNSIPEIEREKMGLIFRDEGEFWMEFGDFLQKYDTLEICNLTPDAPVEMPKQWHTAEFHHRWVRGFSAGGRPSNQDTHWSNPQFSVTLSDRDEDGDNVCSLVIQLMQKDGRKLKQFGKKNQHIGFFVYQNLKSHPLPLKKEFFDNNQSVQSSGLFIDSRQIIKRLTLPRGQYVVIPCTWDINEEAGFYLRFFFENQNTAEDVDEIPEKSDTPLPQHPPDKEREEQFKRFFYAVSGEDMEVTPYELQQTLNEASRKDQHHRNTSIDTCKKFVSLLDTELLGKIGYTEFLYLWNLLKSWKRIYFQYDTDNIGSFSCFELRRALGAAGFTINNSSMQALVFKYSNEKCHIDFDGFLSCLSKLTKLFNDFNNMKQNGQITLSIDQFIQKSFLS